ncbi:hypothetical protein ACFL3Q_05205 [Planctomycetota bacterium]
MNKKSTLYGISPQKVRHLLDDCLNEKQNPQSLKKTSSTEELLREYLTKKCPTGLDEITKNSSIIIVHMQNQMLLRSGKSVAEALSDPKTDLVILREIKEHYKEISFSEDSKRKRHAATAIYFAAIAHALVFHNQKISEYSFDKVYQSLNKIAANQWITADLKNLYIKAQEICQRDLL